MSDIVLVAIITVVGGIITLFINRWFKKMDEKLDKYHKEVNGKMSELLEAKKAQGNLEGRDELKQEQKDNNIN